MSLVCAQIVRRPSISVRVNTIYTADDENGERSSARPFLPGVGGRLRVGSSWIAYFGGLRKFFGDATHHRLGIVDGD